MNKLAIVIPAYKDMYFDQTLSSIANQTCKDFTLYIGNDGSPYNLSKYVNLYQSRIKIIYKLFDPNLGAKDLVAHWERCIDLIGDENWIWLFSDDDTMDPTCVESFYRTMNIYPDYHLFHFNLLQIDESNQIIGDFYGFPEELRSEELLMRRLHGNFNSTAIEYIFNKTHFYENGGFEHFDLAWGSDDATWIKLGKEKGIKNIDNALVYWRISPYNISPNNDDPHILKRKFFAQIDFANWVYKKAKQNEIQIEIVILKKKLTSWFFRKVKDNIHLLSFELLTTLISEFYQSLHNQKSPPHKIASLCIYKTFRFYRQKFANTILRFQDKKIL